MTIQVLNGYPLLFFASTAAFPVPGNVDFMYVDKSTMAIYFWNGSAYALGYGATGPQGPQGTPGVADVSTGEFELKLEHWDRDDNALIGFYKLGLLTTMRLERILRTERKEDNQNPFLAERIREQFLPEYRTLCWVRVATGTSLAYRAAFVEITEEGLVTFSQINNALWTADYPAFIEQFSVSYISRR